MFNTRSTNALLRPLRAGCIAAGLIAGAWLGGWAVRAEAPPASCDRAAVPPMPVTDECPAIPDPDVASFAAMAWQAFRYVTWPVESVALAEVPARFLTFKADWETFRPLAAKPAPWDQPADPAEACGGPPAPERGSLVLSSLHEFGTVGEPGVELPTNALVAQNGRLVRYMTSFGETEFDAISDNKLYDPDARHGDAVPAEAIMVKSAWLEMTPDLEAGRRFYTRLALIRDRPNGPCRSAVVGLVGLHIAIKTPSNPLWVWSSFEHVDNVREEGESGARTFHDATDTQMEARPPKKNVINLTTDPSTFDPKPFNVARLWPIDQDVQAANIEWQPLMAQSPPGVWANYKLVVVQWAGQVRSTGKAIDLQPTPPCNLSFDTNTANTVMETFPQDGIVCGKEVRHTCLGCHVDARSHDFIFAVTLMPERRSPLLGASGERLQTLCKLQATVGVERSRICDQLR